MSAEIKQQALLLKFLKNKKLAVLRHVLLLAPLASAFIPNFSEAAKKDIHFHEVIIPIYKHGIFMFSISVFIIYINILILIPQLLFKNRYLFYTLTFIGSGFVFYLAEYFHGNYVFKGLEKYIGLPGFNIKDIIDNTIIPMIFLGATAGYKVFKKWIIDIQQLNELQKAQLQDELTNLKNQVNPHFLFNTLNNLDTLIQTDTVRASKLVHDLSDILKYQIYESNKELVLLSKDIEIMSQFLMLEKIRREKFEFEINRPDNISGILIHPLLFINFIDNALKHSNDNRKESYLIIKFKIAEKFLFFYVENSKPAFRIQKEKGGFGLKNIQRRLDLLYGDEYQLQLNDEPDKYIVNLKIPI